MPIQRVLLRLVRQTSLSVVADSSLEQTFVGDLKNVTIREALDAVLSPVDLDYAVRGRVIRVFPRELDTRFYNIDYVLTQRSGTRSILESRGDVALGNTDAPGVYTELANGVKALLSADGRMSLDRAAGLLHVTDRPSRVARVEQYLDAVMQRVGRQVQIEAKVIEVELGAEFRDGLDWRALLGGATDGNAIDASSLLKRLATQGTVNVLSSPRIVATNNEPAIVRAGTQDGRSLTDGIVLSVTPQISTDGIIHMNITPSVTARAVTTSSRSGDAMPVTTVREADTVVRVRDGATVVIAGLLQEHPDRGKTDLVILLTPTVVSAANAR
jgi:type II secretory pathway component GspD/PulD (secretin)